VALNEQSALTVAVPMIEVVAPSPVGQIA